MSIPKQLALHYEKEYHTGLSKQSFGGFEEAHWTNNDPRWEQTAHSLNRYFFVPYYKNYKHRLSILELGCGMCSLTTKIKSQAEQAYHYPLSVVGLDISQYALERPLDASISRVRACASSLPFKTGSFDFVVALDVIEHLPYETAFKAGLTDLRRIIRPDGCLLITIPLINLDGSKDILESDGIREHYIVQSQDWWMKELGYQNLEYVDYTHIVKDARCRKMFPFNMSPYNHFMMFIRRPD
jgi:SAM-dependent methyltransferase